MNPEQTRYSPSKVRDAIMRIMSQSTASMSINDIEMRVNHIFKNQSQASSPRSPKLKSVERGDIQVKSKK